MEDMNQKKIEKIEVSIILTFQFPFVRQRAEICVLSQMVTFALFRALFGGRR